MDNKNRLFEVADIQQGFFTSAQAEACGFARSNFHLKIQSKEWVKEERGLYRLAHYPLTQRPELIKWMLWSRNQKGELRGVWSHETALDIYELSDVMPVKMHMTMPLHFRKSGEIPEVLKLHYANLSPSDIETSQGYRITKPLKTLIDVAKEGNIAEEQLILAIRQALQRGLILEREVEKIEQIKMLKEKYEI